MTIFTRRTALLGIPAALIGLSACSSEPPMDEAEVNRRVSQVEGVTSVDIAVKSSGVTDWSLSGTIGLPEDDAQARAVYEDCLRAIASVPTSSDVPMGVYVYGESASGQLDPAAVGAPDRTTSLKEHFS
ncbi:hypothetical protein [Janibacter anophelis]|uniref:hypothetical protein n=1 Tax=Janibacter anophelis TaxID=319054 RepID=UPI000832FD86|nr:hypothetical protein [Janibacter anophelis]